MFIEKNELIFTHHLQVIFIFFIELLGCFFMVLDNFNLAVKRWWTCCP